MTMNPFPPQAYTRETVVKAYQWLQSQNANIRELATTPDLLVSLYLKAQLQGKECLDRPSIQNFKTELKSLAGMMGEFETAPAAEAITEASLARMNSGPARSYAPPHSQRPNGAGQPTLSQNSSSASAHPPTPPQAAAPKPGPTSSQQTQTLSSASPQASGPDHTRSAHHFEMDSRSLQMIREVKVQLNLSSDEEALRAIISIGYTKFKRFAEHS